MNNFKILHSDMVTNFNFDGKQYYQFRFSYLKLSLKKISFPFIPGLWYYVYSWFPPKFNFKIPLNFTGRDLVNKFGIKGRAA